MALSDFQARQVVMNELKKNIFVVAGAGSGKTSILISRMVRMVEEGYDITKICTITFTVNAAAEFLSRFSSTLQKRSFQTLDEYRLDKNTLLPPPTKLSRKRCSEALKNIDLAFMGTIDAFCQKLVSEHPFEAQVPAASSLVTDEELVDLYPKEFENIINGVAPYNAPKLQTALADFLELNDRPAELFKASIKEVIDASSLTIQTQASHDPAKPLEAAYQAILSRYRADLLSDLKELYTYGGAAINFAIELPLYEKSQVGWQNFNNNQSLLLRDWDLKKLSFIAYQIERLVSNLHFSEDPELAITQSFKAFKFKKLTSRDGHKTIYYKLDTTDENRVAAVFKQEVEQLMYDYSLPFLVQAAIFIREKFKKEGRLSFNQWLLVIKNVLKEDKRLHNGKLINHITNRYQYFMLDESQDTSPFQTTIFELLSKQIPGKCTLFIVGDPKQSIYRFRGADAEAYALTRSKYTPIESLDEVDLFTDIQVELLRNFRSSKEMKNYFNNVFASLDNYTTIEISEDEPDTLYHSGAYSYESEQLIPTIQGMVANSNYQTFDRKLGHFRQLQYGDFMVITYTKGHQQTIAQALSEAHIPYNLEGDNVFAQSDLVKSIYAIYTYVANKDTATFYNLLTSSFVGLSPKESLMLTKESDEIPLLENKEAQINFINELVKNSHSLNPLTFYHRILENLALFHADKMDKIHYLFFIEEKIKEALSSFKIASIKDGDRFLKELLVNKCERVSAIAYQPNAIYLANLHKVKGLESPVVILIKAGASTKGPQSRLDFNKQESFLFKIGARGQFGNSFYFSANAADFIEESKKEKMTLDQEKKRLEYVAATRARDYLLVPEKSGVWKSLSVEQDFVLEPRNNGEIDKPAVYKPFSDYQFSINFNKPAIYRLIKPSALHGDFKVDKIAEESLLDDNEKLYETSATVTGTIVDRLMERLALALPDKLPSQPLVQAILYEYGLATGSAYETILKDVYETIVLKGGYPQLANQGTQDIYGVLKDAKKIMCEVPFCYSDGQDMINGFIDLIYVDHSGYHIIDYKSDLVLGEHQAQLSAYKKAVKAMFNIDADAKLYHIKVK
ncbi:MAG: UvrD-helicase domain-containing protein [Erysipelotrichia bacterium]|nr:UvrD-helicase domain-containing protein [Erysipelotrichia bacterium]